MIVNETLSTHILHATNTEIRKGKPIVTGLGQERQGMRRRNLTTEMEQNIFLYYHFW